MMNKVFGAKNITHLLYGIAILLPMLSVLGRVCYTVVNKNAIDSYSDSQVQRYESVTNDTQLLENYEYTLNAINTTSDVYTYRYNFTTCNINFNTLIPATIGHTIVGFALRVPVSGNKFIYAFDTNNNAYEEHSGYVQFILDSLPITFKLKSYEVYNWANTFNNYSLKQIVYTTEKLDNAFEYSLQTFVDDNNLGNVNLFSWFTDLFLDQSKPKNALYLNFVNWYLNYTLLVSSGYLLFMVMIWFTQYIRRIMDKSMYQDFGGF